MDDIENKTISHRMGWKEAFWTIIVFMFLVVLLSCTLKIVSHEACLNFQKVNPGLEVRTDFWSGCLVRSPSGLWINMIDFRDIYFYATPWTKKQ